jgi:hypothetical protein
MEKKKKNVNRSQQRTPEEKQNPKKFQKDPPPGSREDQGVEKTRKAGRTHSSSRRSPPINN